MENKSENKRSWLRITGLVVGALLLISLGIGLWKSREIYRFYEVVSSQELLMAQKFEFIRTHKFV